MQINVELFESLLAVGTAGILCGLAIPIIMRMIGLVIDYVRTIIE